MSNLICPFSATLAKADNGCTRSTPVIRRGGTEFVCDSASAHNRCRSFYDGCKAASLTSLGLEDDLTVVPQATLVKVQFGGLAGLRRLLNDSPAVRRIEDIDGLLETALLRYGSTGQIPYPSLLEDISGYQLSRRRKR